MTDVNIADTQAAHNAPPLDETEGEGWQISGGKVSVQRQQAFLANGIEDLTFNNPFGQGIERVWYDGKVVYALDAGEVEIPSAGEVKVAKEYQPVFAVHLDEKGKLQDKQEVPGQLNIYDSVPGQDKYSPIWQFYYVVVPQDYQVNALRSEQDCLNSGYPIHQSTMFEN